MSGKFSLSRYGMTLTLLVFLSGCQQMQHGKADSKIQQVPLPTIEHQLAQLSAIAGAGYYLKQNCHQSELPSPEQMLAKTVALAAQRGWPVKAGAYQQLPAQSEQVFKKLTEDKTPNEQMCHYFMENIKGYFAP